MMSYKREYLKDHMHNDNDEFLEERSIIGNSTLLQIDPWYCPIHICHSHNTVNKRSLFFKCDYENIMEQHGIRSTNGYSKSFQTFNSISNIRKKGYSKIEDIHIEHDVGKLLEMTASHITFNDNL